jgi:transketolase
MKKSLVSGLINLARLDTSVLLLTGDLGYGAFEPFAEEYPDRFVNCGVAEQNMVGMASGLAKEGFKPVVYSIGNFLALRAAEQIRNDIAAANRQVLLVAAGAGFTYGSAGYSHHLTEDLALMRSLPDIAIYCPGLDTDIDAMIRTWSQGNGAAYLRLDRVDITSPDSSAGFDPGRWRQLRSGTRVGIFTLGSCASLGIEVVDRLSVEGIQGRLFDCNQLSGLDTHFLNNALSGLEVAVSMEEHSTRGGLGGLLAEEITHRGLSLRLLRYGLTSGFVMRAGSPSYFRQMYGLTSGGVLSDVLAVLAQSEGT